MRPMPTIGLAPNWWPILNVMQPSQTLIFRACLHAVIAPYDKGLASDLPPNTGSNGLAIRVQACASVDLIGKKIANASNTRTPTASHR